MKYFLERFGVFLLALLALGLPVATPWALAIFIVVGFLSVLGRPSHHPERVGVALLLAGGIAILAPMLQTPAVMRTEQVFLPRDSAADAVYVGSLPPSVFGYMVERFHAAYPDSGQCPADLENCWIQAPPVTESESFSFDNVWRLPKKKARSTMDFPSLPDLRAGFVHQASSVFQDDGTGVTRAHMPYYVQLVWQKGAVGGTVCWTGTLLWEENGRFVVQASDQMDISACRLIAPDDVGRRVFGLGIDPAEPLRMSFAPKRLAAFRNGVATFLRLAGAFAVVLLLTDLPGLLALWPQALLTLLGGGLMWFRVPGLLLGQYAPLPLGQGLRAEVGGRMVARALLSGDVTTFLTMDAPAFLEAPGGVVFRAFEKFIFGDGFGGTALVMLLLLPILFRLARSMMDAVSAWLVVLVFVSGVLEGIGFSANLFYDAAAMGMPSALAMIVFLGGLALCCPECEHKAYDGLAASALLALATLLDPVLLPACFMVLLFVKSGVGIWKRFAVYGAILALVPVHNVIFSGVPWPENVSLFLTPVAMSPVMWGAYVLAFFKDGNAELGPLFDHFQQVLFLGTGSFAALWAALRIAITIGGIFVVLSRRAWLKPVRLAALGGLSVVVMTVFMMPDINRFMLGGILNFLVACAVVWHIGVRPARPRYVKPSSSVR